MSISNLQNYIYNSVDGYTYVVNPDRLYVSSFSTNEVLEVNSLTGEITNRIPSSKFPFQSILVNEELITFTLWESTPSYIQDKDVKPWIFFLTCPYKIPRNTWHQTNTLLIGGLNVETPISVPNLYSVEIWKNGVNVGQSSTVVNDDQVYIRFLSPNEESEKIEIPLFVGEGYNYFQTRTDSSSDIDTIPFYLTYHTNHYVPLNGTTISNTLNISGIPDDESVDIEIEPLNVGNSHFYNLMSPSFIKNGTPTDSKYTTIENGDTLSVSAFVCGASWNGYIQEFKIYRIQKNLDEFGEIVSVDRLEEVGFWRYVTAYLESASWNRHKEIPIQISPSYEKGVVYSKQIGVAETAIKAPVYGYQHQSDYQIPHKSHREISTDVVKNSQNITTADISYQKNTTHHISVTNTVEPILSKPKFVEHEIDYVLSKRTQAQQQTSWVDVHKTSPEVSVSGYEVSGITKKTQDTSFERIPEKTIREQSTEFDVYGVNRYSLDCDYVKLQKHIIIADSPLSDLDPIHVPNRSAHEVSRLTPEVVTKRRATISTEVEAAQPKQIVSLNHEYFLDVYRHSIHQISSDYNFALKSNDKTQDADYSVYLRTDRFSQETEFFKERYYHYRVLDSQYDIGAGKKLVEFENPYIHLSYAFNVHDIDQSYEKITINSDHIIGHQYLHNSPHSSILYSSEYVNGGNVSKINVESDYDVRHAANSYENPSAFDITTRHFVSLVADYSINTHNSYEIGADATIISKNVSFATSEYLINNAHTLKLISVDYDVVHRSVVQISSTYDIHKSNSVLLAAEYVLFGQKAGRTVDVQYVHTPRIGNREIDSSYEKAHNAISKFVDIQYSVSTRSPSQEISRSFEVVTRTTFEENYTDEQFRAFDTESEAIAYAMALGTIVNPKAMRLSSGKWFYYGDSNIQNASCKISYPYPKEGYLHGG